MPPTTATTSTSGSAAREAEPPSSPPSRSRVAAWAAAQALAAFADNFLRASLAWWVVVHLPDPRAWAAAIAGSVLAFAVPSAVLSGIAGRTADLGDAPRAALIAQGWGAAAGVLGAVGLARGDGRILAVALGAAGIRAALASPARYTVLRRLLPEHRALAGNAAVEAGIWLAALLGTGAAVVSVLPAPGLAAALAALPAVAALVAAWGFARGTSGPRPAGTGLVAATREALAAARADRATWRATLALAWFWGVAQGFVAWLPAYVVHDLHAEPRVGVALALAFAVGVVAGALAVDRLSAGWLELGVVPIGTLGISVAAFALPALRAPWAAALALAGVGAGAAFLAVPLHTAVATWAPASSHGRIFAAGNLVSAVTLAFGAVAFGALAASGWPIGRIWLAVAVANLVFTAALYRAAPEFLLRLLAWLLSRGLYRVEVAGADHVPRAGPAVLVSNHVTYVDWLLMMGAIRRPARFVMYKGFFDIPVASVLFRQAGVIPIAGAREDPAMLERAMDEVSATLRRGHLVVIFPEGALSPDGEIGIFRPGIERIVGRDPVPVVPMALNGLWGSFFSRFDGRAFRRLFPRGVRSPVWVTFGPALAPEGLSATAVQDAVRALWVRRSER